MRTPKSLREANRKPYEFLKKRNKMILYEDSGNLTKVFSLLISLPDDFLSKEREDRIPQER